MILVTIFRIGLYQFLHIYAKIVLHLYMKFTGKIFLFSLIHETLFIYFCYRIGITLSNTYKI